ncbi:MAG: DUF459 domain-containing protein [Desulfovibrionaceae bacterium]|nr:DUF459 domain-containing protein [Desulfovibrionaceae bacterium]
MTRRIRLRTWFPAFGIYVTAFMVVGFFNIEKITLWAEDRIAETHSSRILRGLRAVRDVYRHSPLANLTADADRALAPLFHDTYKSTPITGDSSASADGRKTGTEAEDPYAVVKRPTVKGLRPLDRNQLMAALAPEAAPAVPETDMPADPATPADIAVRADAAPPDQGTFSLTQARLEPPHRILVVGDSLAIGLALSLRRAMNEYQDVTLIEEGKVSSGLANPKYFNWEKALQTFVEKYSPTMVVVMMGANDAKYINLDEKPREPGSPNKSWAEVFAMRMEGFLDIPAKRDLPVFWIGLPVMGDPTYARQAQAMNDIVRTECGKYPNCRFLDTWNLLCDPEDTYAAFLKNDKGAKVKIRANDKIHFTVAGGDILAQSFFDQASNHAVFRGKSEQAAETAAGGQTSAGAP